MSGSAYSKDPQQTRSPVIVGGQASVVSKDDIVICGTTYQAGAQATITGTPISVGADNLVIGKSTLALPSYPTESPIIIDGNAITRASNGEVVFHGTTIAPNAQATIGGHTLSAGVSSIILDGTGHLLPLPGVAFTILEPARGIITLANGVALSAGGAETVVSGITYSVPSDQNNLIVNGRTTALPAAHELKADIITLANVMGTPAGDAEAIVSGTTYSIPSDEQNLTVNGRTTALSPMHTSKADIITLANGVAISAGGSAAMMSGTTYSVPMGGGELVANGKTMTLPSSIQSVFTEAGHKFIAAPDGFTVDGQNVTLNGAAITISGSVVSLGPSGVDIGSSTMPLTPAQRTVKSDLGSLIMSGYGHGGGSPDNSSVSLDFTGAGSRLADELLTTGLALFGISIGILACAF